MAIRQVTRAGVGLVVGIIILAALVFGGLWLVRERGEQARREEAINIADQQLQAESDEEIALDTNEGSGSTTESEDSTEATTPQPGTAAPETPSNATELPQTGPEATSVLALGLLSFAIASFIRSRKLVAERL